MFYYFILFFSFLLYYFSQTHNTEFVYKITSESENYEILNGIFFVTREQSYLKIGAINNLILDIELFYKKDGNKKIIYTGSSDNIVVDFTGYNSGINLKNINNIKDYLFLKINNDEIKLKLSKQYVNDKFVLHDLDNDLLESHSNMKIIPYKIKNNFDCVNDTCSLHLKDVDIVYDVNANMIFMNDTNFEFLADYNLNTNTFNYSGENINYTVINNELICNVSDCSKYYVSYDRYFNKILKNYI